MARKIYLVDTENVGFVWKHLLEELSTNDKIILFYTENTPSLSYVDLAYIQALCDKFTLEKCYVGKNALDFQLVSYMGYHMKSSPKTHFLIVSNDSGYDSVIRYWSDKGRDITRMTTRDVETLSMKKTMEKLEGNQVMEENIIQNALKESYPEEEIQWVLQMLEQHSSKELQAIHTDILKKYGQGDGAILYRAIKPLLKGYYKKVK